MSTQQSVITCVVLNLHTTLEFVKSLHKNALGMRLYLVICSFCFNLFENDFLTLFLNNSLHVTVEVYEAYC